MKNNEKKSKINQYKKFSNYIKDLEKKIQKDINKINFFIKKCLNPIKNMQVMVTF